MDYLKISADDHIDLGYLPKDLWLDRVPRALRARAPHVEDRGDAGESWVCEDFTWGDYRGERFFANPDRNRSALDRLGLAEPGRPITPAKRLEDMDRDGIEASLMFPPIIELHIEDPALRNACVSAYNDWAVEFAAASPDRFFPVAALSPVDPAAAADELLRIAKGGRLKEVAFLVNDVTTDLYLEPWDRFWDLAEETGMIVSYHVGGSLQSNTLRGRRTSLAGTKRVPAFDLGAGNAGGAFLESFVNLFSFGTLERHPNLRFVLAESGTGWIPYVVQEMDYRLQKEAGLKGTSMLNERPSDIFRRQVWATYQADLVGLNLVDFFGDGHMLWASDYPHADGTWPYSDEVVKRETAHLSEGVRRKILRDNAIALFGLA